MALVCSVAAGWFELFVSCFFSKTKQPPHGLNASAHPFLTVAVPARCLPHFGNFGSPLPSFSISPRPIPVQANPGPGDLLGACPMSNVRTIPGYILNIKILHIYFEVFSCLFLDIIWTRKGFMWLLENVALTNVE